MAEAARYMKDDKRSAQWEQLFEMAVSDVERADQRDRFPDFGLQMRSDVGAV
jgi:hypothetical protein